MKYRTIVRESADAASSSSSAPRNKRVWEDGSSIYGQSPEVEVKMDWTKCRSEIELEFVRRAPRSRIPEGTEYFLKSADHIPKYYI